MKLDKKQSKFRFFILLLVGLGLFITAGSVAAGMHMRDRENRHTLEEGATLDGPGFFSGDLIQIDGTVDGTTFAAGEEIRVNGDINGSLFAAGQRIIITGVVNGNIYGAGEVIELSGQSEGEVFLAGETVTIDEGAEIGRDAFAAGLYVNVNGPVPRHLYTAGERVTVNSLIGGNAAVTAERVILTDSAEVDGDLDYDSPNEADTSLGATVAGQTNWTQTEGWNRRTLSQQTRWILTFFWVLWSILSTLVVWFVIRLISKEFWVNTVWPIADQPLKTVKTGLLGLIATPFVAGLLLLTVIGIPMGLILFTLYGLALYFATIIVALFIGALLFRLAGRTEGNNEFLVLLIGVLILEILKIIPVVNLIVWLVVAVIGLGALIISRRENNKPADIFADY